MIHKNAGRRYGATLIEILVVASVVAVFVGLLAAAVQQARASAARAACANNLRQLVVAVHGYVAQGGPLPRGCEYPAPTRQQINVNTGMSWQTSLLPSLGEPAVWANAVAAFAADPAGNQPSLHAKAATAAPAVFRCPSETLATNAVTGFGLTSYQGVAGTSLRREDGVFHQWVLLRYADLTDGASNTLMAGERPVVSTAVAASGTATGAPPTAATPNSFPPVSTPRRRTGSAAT